MSSPNFSVNIPSNITKEFIHKVIVDMNICAIKEVHMIRYETYTKAVFIVYCWLGNGQKTMRDLSSKTAFKIFHNIENEPAWYGELYEAFPCPSFFVNIPTNVTEEFLHKLITDLNICVIKEIQLIPYKTFTKAIFIVDWTPRGKNTMQDLTRGTPFAIWHNIKDQPAWYGELHNKIYC